MDSRPAPLSVEPVGHRICHYVKKLPPLMAFSAAIPNMQFAAGFSYNGASVLPKEVAYNWFVNLSVGKKIGAIYNSFTTLCVSGLFGYLFIDKSLAKMKEEWALFRKRKNIKRFITEVSMALLAAITGSLISGLNFTGIWQWIFRILGFTTTGGLSFLGISELLIHLFDSNHALKVKIINRLEMLTPEGKKQALALLEGKKLTPENLTEFLKKFFALAAANENNFFKEKDQRTNRRELCYKASDYAISTVFTSTFTLYVYGESGFAGMNVFFGNILTNIPNATKILIGLLVGSPLILFIFFTLKIFNGPLFELFPEMKADSHPILKNILLLAFSAGNATWFQSLARTIADSENIFAFLLSTGFGVYVFPWSGYLACAALGVNGLFPMLFPPKINTEQPTLSDVSKYLKYQMPLDAFEELLKHSLFKPKSNAQVELRRVVVDEEEKPLFLEEKRLVSVVSP